MTKSPLDELIGQIYQAALQPELWLSVLADIRDTLDASAFSLFSLGTEAGQAPELFTHNIDPEWSKDYREYWWQHDLWVQGAASQGLVKPGITLSGSMLIDPKAFLKSRWFNEALRQQELGDLLTTTLWSQDKPNPKFVLSFYRTPKSRRFEEKEIEQLHLVSRHLQRSLALTFHGSQRDNELRQSHAIIDGITEPLLILNDQGKVVSLNNPAEKLLARRERQIVHLKGNRVIGLGRLARPSLADTFQIARNNMGQHVSIAFVFEADNHHQQAGSARLIKLPSPTLSMIGPQHEARFMLLIDPAEIPSKETLGALAGLFGLTRAEVSVLALLVEDNPPLMIAEQLGISLPTVRSHLQHIRQKTGTRRISDLMRLVIATSKSG